MKAKDLIHLAEAARERAYAPYSGYLVGAALLGKSGKVYLGCNVENASSSATSCAERTAFFKAVSEGEREFQAIAIVGGKKGEKGGFCPPCGTCRQVMAEFCGGDFPIVLGTPDDYKIHTLSELLPLAFTPRSLS
ncbi:MAG: cytidine deaminase [Clostridia bacterium]|nr:cytidine deaminase [Clostridia bacterium]